jgi:hypothetical protein
MRPSVLGLRTNKRPSLERPSLGGDQTVGRARRSSRTSGAEWGSAPPRHNRGW